MLWLRKGAHSSMTLLCLSPRSKGFFQPFPFPRTKVLPYADHSGSYRVQSKWRTSSTLPLMENKREEEERQLSSIPWYDISQISQSESVMIFSLGSGDSYVAKGSWASYQGLEVQLPLLNEGDRPRWRKDEMKEQWDWGWWKMLTACGVSPKIWWKTSPSCNPLSVPLENEL